MIEIAIYLLWGYQKDNEIIEGKCAGDKIYVQEAEHELYSQLFTSSQYTFVITLARRQNINHRGPPS